MSCVYRLNGGRKEGASAVCCTAVCGSPTRVRIYTPFRVLHYDAEEYDINVVCGCWFYDRVTDRFLPGSTPIWIQLFCVFVICTIVWLFLIK